MTLVRAKKHLGQHFLTDKNIAACQPKILSYYDKKMFEHAGACGGWIDKLGYPFARGRIFDVCEEDKGQYDTVEKVFWATGAALCIRASCFHEMDGFDSHLFAHMEEIDLCWRLQRKGYSIYCCASSAVYHVGGGTLARTNSRKTYLNFRNNLIMLGKNLPWSEKIWKFPFRIFLDAVFAWKSLLSGYSESFVAVLKAHFAVLKWCISGKTNHQKKIHLKKLAGVYRGSIIVQHFIKKKTMFSEIIKKNF